MVPPISRPFMVPLFQEVFMVPPISKKKIMVPPISRHSQYTSFALTLVTCDLQLTFFLWKMLQIMKTILLS